MEIALSFGSNQGDRLARLSEAGRRIGAIPGVGIVARSRVYETEPVDVAPEHAGMLFLNALMIIETELDLHTLLGHLHAIERDMGRKRGQERNLPRPIDIDIVYAGALSLGDAALTVPHPSWATRRFVVQPLCDVRPDVCVPGQGRTARDVLGSLPEVPAVTAVRETW